VALVLDADPDTRGLLRAWLGDAGWRVVDMPAAPGAAVGLVVIELAYPRDADASRLRRLADAYAGAPVIALSATFHANVDAHGAVARAFDVAGVLPKPLRREALLAAVHRATGGGACA